MKKNVSINSFTKEELHNYVFDLGEKKYRAKQLWKWLYVNGAKSFNEMSDIGLKLQKKFCMKSNHQHLYYLEGLDQYLIKMLLN